MATLDIVIALVFLLFAFLTLAVPAMFHGWNRVTSFRRRKSYGELGADFLDSVQGLATLKAFGQSKIRGAALAERARRLYRSTMGVVAANGATSGASIFFMAAGAAVALALGAVRVSGGDMELRPLLIVLMLGVEVFRPMRELTNLYHQGMTVLSSAQSVFAMIDEPATVREPEQTAASRLPGRPSAGDVRERLFRVRRRPPARARGRLVRAAAGGDPGRRRTERGGQVHARLADVPLLRPAAGDR